MFTGIVRHVGSVWAVRPATAGARLEIDLGPLVEGLGLGDSVAVNGACLTAVSIDGGRVGFDAVRETLERSGLGELRVGTRVNLERSLRLADALDGHLVQGHVDGRAVVRSIDASGSGHWAFAADASLTDWMVPKGSVAIDGVSLTLVDVSPEGFSLALIPATLEATTLGERRVGDRVNVETDVIGKYVRKYLTQASAGEGLTMDKLRAAGFA